MNLFTIIHKGKTYPVSDEKFFGYVCIALLILIVLIFSIALLSWHVGKQGLIAEIKQAIKGNEYKKVEDFEFFRSTKNQTYITTNNYREVADISLTPPPTLDFSIAGASDEGRRRTW